MSYRAGFLLLLAVFVLHFSRILFLGEVIFPHDNSIETGKRTEETDARVSNRKFSDQSSVFIPELANNLGADHRAWLNTWNSHVELGRPAFQGALSRAFLFTNLLSWFSSNPFVLYTALILISVGLTAVFQLLFLRSLGLHPAACACAALGLAFTTPVSYWLCFVMFVSAFCWPIGLLWLITEFIRKPSWIAALGLSFATYCLLLTSYPQVTILSAYLIVPYALIRVIQSPGMQRQKLQLLLAMFGCAIAGLLASLPVYLDLLATARDSARLSDVTDAFFRAVLPPCRSLSELGGFLVTLFDWSWLGNVISTKYPVPFNGLSFTPIYGCLLWLSFLLKNRREVLFWQVFLILCLAATIFPSLYLFAVHHLGYGLSRIQPAGGGIIPGFVLTAFAVDAILRGELRLTIGSAAWLLIPLVAESVMALLIWDRHSINTVAVAVTFLFVGTLLCFLRWRRISLLLAVAVISTYLYGRTLILSRLPHSIHTSSKLVDEISARTTNKERFAIADATVAALPPNQEALLGLWSVNSYDSLSSRRYQELTRRWSHLGTQVFGRYFKTVEIQRLMDDPEFALSNIHVILSARPLTTNLLQPVFESNGIKLYETVAAPIGLLQTTAFQLSDATEAVIDPSHVASDLQSDRVETLNDFQKIEVTPVPEETLLFLSQQYHHAWQAVAGDKLLRTVIVNRFYQGIIVPPRTTQVEISFRPFVVWSWLPQALFAAAGVILLIRVRLRRSGSFAS